MKQKSVLLSRVHSKLTAHGLLARIKTVSAVITGLRLFDLKKAAGLSQFMMSLYETAWRVSVPILDRPNE